MATLTLVNLIMVALNTFFVVSLYRWEKAERKKQAEIVIPSGKASGEKEEDEKPEKEEETLQINMSDLQKAMALMNGVGKS